MLALLLARCWWCPWRCRTQLFSVYSPTLDVRLFVYRQSALSIYLLFSIWVGVELLVLFLCYVVASNDRCIPFADRLCSLPIFYVFVCLFIYLPYSLSFIVLFMKNCFDGFDVALVCSSWFVMRSGLMLYILLNALFWSMDFLKCLTWLRRVGLVDMLMMFWRMQSIVSFCFFIDKLRKRWSLVNVLLFLLLSI